MANLILVLQAFTEVFCKRRVLRKVFAKNSQGNTCVRDSILIKLHTLGSKNEYLSQVFSCEFSEISTKTFFTEHLQTTASVFSFSEAVTGGVL